MRIRLFTASLALMVAGACAEAADRALVITCAEAGALELSVPDSWTVEESRHDVRMPPTLTVSAPDGTAQWVVTAVWKAADRKPPSTLDEIRTRVARTAQTVGAADAPLQPVPSGSPVGYFFDAGGSITPEPFSMLRQGMLKVGELTVSFTAMGAAGRSADQDALVERLARATHRR
ncbi:MAG: hypothetical protein JNK71_06820 [Methyloversatilis sp.]|uniref:hypothetical protein n=1 Tax=Methyloversatilis sp. TaxID=2569862 RepID=UPI001A4E3D7F|nr:hypothetical protein [Methyloversatilis sp.]MBL8475773.1 hypothetical protein [Methyloversatilis sp.]